MKTDFSLAQLANVETQALDDILRKCVHCGFCNATCPTFVLTGNELEGPRGRIYLMKSVLEEGRLPAREEIAHIDSCLTCLACETTCPSGVKYSHLADKIRIQIKEGKSRTVTQRLARRLLGLVLPRPLVFRNLLRIGSAFRFLSPLLPTGLANWLAKAPTQIPVEVFPEQSIHDREQNTYVLHPGCAQRVVRPQTNAAVVRLLERHGQRVSVASEAPCCGALSRHMGDEAQAKYFSGRISAAISKREGERVLIAATGCTSHLKETLDPRCVQDLSEVYADLDLKPSQRTAGVRIAYHAPCSLSHDVRNAASPLSALRRVGFDVIEIAEAHLCCGSAGTYALLQPEMSAALRDRKLGHLSGTEVDAIATSNVGCQSHLSDAAQTPVMHVVELLDWATGGPLPEGLELPATKRAKG